MKRSTFLALTALLGCASAATAQMQPMDIAGDQTAGHEWRIPARFSGTVQSVDPNTGRITVKNNRGATRDFTAGSDAKIRRGRTGASLGDIKVGDRVNIDYKGSETRPVVRGVDIRRPAK